MSKFVSKLSLEEQLKKAIKELDILSCTEVRSHSVVAWERKMIKLDKLNQKIYRLRKELALSSKACFLLSNGDIFTERGEIYRLEIASDGKMFKTNLIRSIGGKSEFVPNPLKVYKPLSRLGLVKELLRFFYDKDDKKINVKNVLNKV